MSTSCEESVVCLRKITGKNIPLYKVDIRDKDNVCKVLLDEKIEAIIHFAAYSLVGESMTNPLKYYENNLYGTKQLLQALVEEKVIGTKDYATDEKQAALVETDSFIFCRIYRASVARITT